MPAQRKVIKVKGNKSEGGTKGHFFEYGDFVALEQDEQELYALSSNTITLAYALIEHYGRWRSRYVVDLTADEIVGLTDDEWHKIEEIYENALLELSEMVRLDQLVKAQLITYSGLTGETVNLDLDDPDNPLNSASEFTSSTPFYVKKAFAPDMSIANALYRAFHADRGIMYSAEYSNSVYGVPVADLLKELKQQIASDPAIIKQIADTLTAVNSIAQNTKTSADNTASHQEILNGLLDDLVKKGGDAAILQTIATTLTTVGGVATATQTTANNTAAGQQAITASNQNIQNLISKLSLATGGGGNQTLDSNELQELLRLMGELLYKQEETASDALTYQEGIGKQLKLIATSLGQIVGAAKAISTAIGGIKLELPAINLAQIAAPLNKISLALGEPNVNSAWDWFTGAVPQPKNILDTLLQMLNLQYKQNEIEGGDPPEEVE